VGEFLGLLAARGEGARLNGGQGQGGQEAGGLPQLLDQLADLRAGSGGEQAGELAPLLLVEEDGTLAGQDVLVRGSRALLGWVGQR
jgi:hypothetical protein